MKAEEVAAEKLFTAGQQLLIPRWQRRYSWERQHWDELWNDVARLLENADGDATHFLGSFVLKTLHWTGMPSESRQYFVVDGQQRMTTLTVLIAALRDEKASRYTDDPDQKAVREKLTRQLLRNVELDEGHRARLVLQEPDNTQLIKIIDGPRASNKQPVTKAYDYFRDRMGKLPSEELDRLLSIVLIRLTGVWVTLEATDNAHRVFQTLNAGGKPLQPADLVRNYFFLLLDDRGEKFYVDHWSDMEQALGARGLSHFLQAWTISEGHAGSSGSLFSYFQRDLASFEEDPDAIYAYGKELTETSTLYQIIAGNLHEEDDEVSKVLHDLRRWGSGTAEGLILTLFRMRAEGRIESKHLALSLADIFSFMARRFVAGFEPNLHKSIFVGVARRLGEHDDATGDDVVELLRVVLSRGQDVRTWPRDSMIMDRCVTTPLYTPSRRHWAFSVLEHANRAMVKNPKLAPPPLSRDEYSVEHVLPQKLTEGWENDLKSWGATNISEFHQSRLHVLGNLSLTVINPELSNKRFGEKKHDMEDDWLPLNKQIVSSDEWTESKVDERSRKLANIITGIFTPPLTEAAINASKFSQEAEPEIADDAGEADDEASISDD